MENILLEFNTASGNHRKSIPSSLASKYVNRMMISSSCSEYEAIKFFVETIVSDLKGVTSYTFSWEDDDDFIHSMSKEL